jgi:hypothetical protein
MKQGRKAKLLVSVRSPDEAAAAVKAGADLIDVKEPAKGSLAPAEAEVVAAVLDVVNKAVPVSAALGEWAGNALVEAHWHLQLPLDYIKWGLAGYTHTPGWGEDLLDTRRQIKRGTEVVAVAYADHARAKSVPPAEVAKFAKRYKYKAFLLDTCVKDKKNLLDFLDPEEIGELVTTLQAGGVAVAVGGSLKLEDLKKLKGVTPDWYAVRGAVCVGGKRDADLDPARVKKWKDALK